MALISLVLATYGRCDDVVRFLDSLAKQTDRYFELLVIDQNTDDRLIVPIERGIELGLNIRHYREKTPNLSGARNRGIAEARGNIIGFPDDDCWYEPNTIAELRSVMQRHPSVDGVAGMWVEQLAAGGAIPHGGALLRDEWRRFKGRYASSITLFFRSSAFERWGTFDTRLGVGQWYGAGEETDLVMGFLSKGAELLFSPDLRVHHHFGGAISIGFFAACAAARRRGRGTGAIYAKHAMDSWVVLRGLVGQALRPFIARQFRAFVLGLCASFGSLEGLCRWKLDTYRGPVDSRLAQTNERTGR